MRRIVPKSLRGYSAIGEDCAPIWAIRGVNLEASYINEFAANTQGGMSREATYADQFYFGGSFDLERLVALQGSKIVFSLTDRNGESLSAKAGLNTLLEVQEIYGLGNFARLNQLYWEQHLLDDWVLLRFGRLTGTFDFMPFSCFVTVRSGPS